MKINIIRMGPNQTSTVGPDGVVILNRRPRLWFRAVARGLVRGDADLPHTGHFDESHLTGSENVASSSAGDVFGAARREPEPVLQVDDERERLVGLITALRGQPDAESLWRLDVYGPLGRSDSAEVLRPHVAVDPLSRHQTESVSGTRDLPPDSQGRW
jgi:hypothetical protein